MAGFTGHRERAAVRLVTAEASLMPRAHFMAHLGVAPRACCTAASGLMGQPSMTTFARGVPGARRRQRELLLMTALANDMLRERGLEVVRLMTTDARRSFVKRVIARGRSMTAATRLCHHQRLRGRGMRLVTTHATAAGRTLWMIRVNIPVTVCAGRGWRLPNVVRRMAARAARVFGHAGCRQRQHVLVT